MPPRRSGMHNDTEETSSITLKMFLQCDSPREVIVYGVMIGGAWWYKVLLPYLLQASIPLSSSPPRICHLFLHFLGHSHSALLPPYSILILLPSPLPSQPRFVHVLHLLRVISTSPLAPFFFIRLCPTSSLLNIPSQTSHSLLSSTPSSHLVPLPFTKNPTISSNLTFAGLLQSSSTSWNYSHWPTSSSHTAPSIFLL